MKEKTDRPQDIADVIYLRKITEGPKRMTDKPLLYYRTDEEIEAYRKKPAIEKLRWLETQMEFFYKAMPKKVKEIKDKLKRGKL